MTVRTRIAPSPTGDPHVGTAYVALFNMAFARSQGGEFLLRIEDTDQARSTPESEKAILDALHWLGLGWEEGPDNGGPKGPYRQSERSEIYRKHADQLLESGHAFRCFCTSERLDELRAIQMENKQQLGYDGHCMHIDQAEAASRAAQGESHVVRMRVPREGQCTFNDMLRGEISIDWAQIDLQILLKADGMPTYHLANVVDDHLMEISHVIRGEEWINSAPSIFYFTNILVGIRQSSVICHYFVTLTRASYRNVKIQLVFFTINVWVIYPRLYLIISVVWVGLCQMRGRNLICRKCWQSSIFSGYLSVDLCLMLKSLVGSMDCGFVKS